MAEFAGARRLTGNDDVTELVLTEFHDLKNGRAAVLRLNRPQDLNPLDKDTVAALNRSMDALLADASVGAVIVTGEGSAFSAGGDLKGYLDLYLDEPAFRRFLAGLKTFFDKLENGRLISVAAVNGACVAGGFELALACDLIVMSSSARMGDGHLRYWQLPGAGGSQRLTRAVGLNLAKQILYSYQIYDAQRCQAIGLSAASFEPDQLLAGALAMVDRMMTTPSETVTVMKRLLKASVEMPLEQGLDYEIEEVVRHAIGQDAPAYKGLLRFTERPRAANPTSDRDKT